VSLMANQFWARSPDPWRIVCAVVFLSLASLLSWTATRALGRHLRFDAALNPDHELVRSGPYRIVRHPIYSSMLCLLLGTGFLITSIPLLLAAVAIFICGTEIRVHVEDGLLASRFGVAFREYQRGISAYIPFLR
jgi:protein-S-isoprenylcysteine O-methyltransferase Ste14